MEATGLLMPSISQGKNHPVRDVFVPSLKDGVRPKAFTESKHQRLSSTGNGNDKLSSFNFFQYETPVTYAPFETEIQKKSKK